MSKHDTLRMIASDAETDAAALDGMPFSGHTIGTNFGQVYAALNALANIVLETLPPENPDAAAAESQRAELGIRDESRDPPPAAIASQDTPPETTRETLEAIAGLARITLRMTESALSADLKNHFTEKVFEAISDPKTTVRRETKEGL